MSLNGTKLPFGDVCKTVAIEGNADEVADLETRPRSARPRAICVARV